MTPSSLSLRSFGVAFGERTILSRVDLDLPPRGLTVVVGPSGGGKSTLLRTLAGLNDNHPSLTVWGELRVNGVLASLLASGATGGPRRPALVMQHARFFLDTVRENLVSALPNRGKLDVREQTRRVTQHLEESGLSALVPLLDQNAVSLSLSLQRRLAIARAALSGASVLFADEPTATLEPQGSAEVIAMLRAEGARRAVVLVTHNQRDAMAAGGTTVFLAGGRVQEVAPTEAFFSNPQTEAGKGFVRTGGCPVPSPNASPETLSEDVAPPPPPVVPAPERRAARPRGFFWVVPGQLGGMPRPGLIERLDEDLDGMKLLGVTVLVTLEESLTVSPALLQSLGIRSVHFPVVDMSVPEVGAAISLCGRIEQWMGEGDTVAVHCRAGLGRTGTLLACQLISSGYSARAALEAVRGINPRCIQSDVQVEFLRIFETSRRALAARAPAVT